MQNTASGEAAQADAIHAEAMRRGAMLHAQGRLEQALIAFETALAARPADVNTASACATLLTALARPAAAYRTLLGVEPALLASADGAANLAITAESCGDMERAHRAYGRALELDPRHLRSLNNLGLLAGADGRWDSAIDLAQRHVGAAPDQPTGHVNLCDFLCGARRHGEALAVLNSALSQFPLDTGLRIRLPLVLAFNGDFAASEQARAGLETTERAALRELLQRLATPPDADRKPPGPRTDEPDAWQIYCRQAFEALWLCDWRENDRLTATLRLMLARAAEDGAGRDWRDAAFYAQVLPLDEHELTQLQRVSIAGIDRQLRTRLPAFVTRPAVPPRDDGRLHVGLAVAGLRDERHAQALRRQLALHDSTRFALHLYSPTRPPLADHADSFAPHAGFVEIAHLSDLEAAGRMRLDRLDLFVDMSLHTPWYRPEIAAMRVAPVQLCPSGRHRHHPGGPFDYLLSDRFIHPDGMDLAACGPVVRLPHSCWLALNDEAPSPHLASRELAGLPAGALLLCALVPPVLIDPQTFALWMKILRGLPDAVLWLPWCDLASAVNLAAQARAAGVADTRLLFAHQPVRSDALACLAHADLFLDTLRCNADLGLADALRSGVPAVGCTGQSMASRLGGSILRAAGLAGAVMDSPQAYLAEVLRLGRDPAALRQRREQLRAARAEAPLFDLEARVRETESAWSTMVERSRAGLPPAAFDVASAPRSSTF